MNSPIYNLRPRRQGAIPDVVFILLIANALVYALERFNPEIVIGSWCGVRFNPSWVQQRPGWAAVDAVQRGRLYEIKSTYILQPGPAALTEGVRQLHYVIASVMGLDVPDGLRPAEKTDPALA